MASEFYFARDEKKYGPFTAEQLKQFAASGRLLPTDKVWKSDLIHKDGAEKWVPANRVKGLFPSGEQQQPTARQANVPSPPVEEVPAVLPVESANPFEFEPPAHQEGNVAAQDQKSTLDPARGIKALLVILGLVCLIAFGQFIKPSSSPVKPSPETKWIVNTWVSDNGGLRYTFHRNGKFEVTALDITLSGTYRLLDANSVETTFVHKGRTKRDVQKLMVTENSLTLWNEEGESQTLRPALYRP